MQKEVNESIRICTHYFGRRHVDVHDRLPVRTYSVQAEDHMRFRTLFTVPSMGLFTQFNHDVIYDGQICFVHATGDGDLEHEVVE